MKRRLLMLILTVARRLGLFYLARALTARELRILCYHGCALRDESVFNPGLFQTAETFGRRMRFLSDRGYPVIPLERALRALDDGDLPPNATVITIDDGWFGTYKHQYPVLRDYAFPATLYVSSYYVERQTQVFNVALRYAIWKSGKSRIDLRALGSEIDGALGSVGEVDGDRAYELINGYAGSLKGAAVRQSLLREICGALAVDCGALEAARMFGFMTLGEAREMTDAGIDLQLHTHRHRFPVDQSLEAARREIDCNRHSLASVARSSLTHFCYPSGIYSERTKSHLQALGVASATTTDPGFNRSSTPRLELRRFLDSESVSELEFEAEMSGFFELIRKTGYAI